MKRTDMLRIIQEDQKIFALAKDSGVLDCVYHPNNYIGRRTFRTAATLATKHFWQTFEGVKLRIYLESEYNIGSFSQEMSAFKDALIIVFHSGWYRGLEGGEKS